MLVWTHLGGRLTCWPTKLMGTECFVNLVNTPVTVRCPSNGHSVSSTSGLLAPAAQSSAGRAACSLLNAAGSATAQASPPHCTPIAGLAIPLLTHTCCYSTATATSHSSEPVPSYSSTRGHPLSCLPRIRVIPFLGLAVVHCPGALGTAWSTWSRNGFHRTWTVRGEADSWVHDGSKEVPPYYAENNDSST